MTGWLVAGAVVLIGYMIQLAAVIVLERRRPEKLAAWLLLVLLFPYIGFAARLLLGRSGAGRDERQWDYERQMFREASGASLCANVAGDSGNAQLACDSKLFQLLTADQNRQITLRNRTKVLTNGHDFFEAVLDAIGSAKHHIHLDFYTIRDDGIGQRFLSELTAKARQGVEVRVLYDGIGSIRLNKKYVAELEAAGVQTQCFLKPRRAVAGLLFNNRNHSKIAVIDGEISFVGGMNIGNEYLGKNKKLGFWRDTQLQLEGDSVYWLQELFLKDWAFTAGERLPCRRYMPEHRKAMRQEAVLIVSSGPDRNGAPILETMFAAATAAQSRIYMTTPYFIPDSSLLTALCVAARSGIDVRLIIPGVADTQLVLWATLSYVEPLLASGVKVYRYQKGFIHAKVMLIDHMLASVGTANMDMRSFHSNFEQNALLFDEQTIARLERDFEQDLRDSTELHLESFRSRSKRQKLAEAAAHLLSPLL
ncbi:cardiolipin synthase [Paenibacillus sp. NEAU-GSW1]|uniref:cardiolipin synthase n=1 Tax=Paenibacillus sp. NEAU-GSW1 TaxID=2682486 RepID=UPI0012E1CCA7|nr:cardiolipin synthase [Paenibacillus sp. NEAU-GSW1]MUT67640.1 cardiolipin synthase [Paenibacillus sp. NEAU-GSW1]